MCSLRGHEFWIDDVSIRQLISSDAVVPSPQVTDLYLLGLAVRNGGKLATLDRGILAGAIARGAESLELIE
jgi:hypothetical protein